MTIHPGDDALPAGPAAHWEAVYRARDEQQLSWHQDEPLVSLALIQRLCPPAGRVADIGGGTSLLGRRLVESGYEDVTVVDVSPSAIERARERSGAAADQVRWVVGDVMDADLHLGPLALWHDRAVFHFLTAADARRRYAGKMAASVPPGGHAVLATFALDGPERCSGLPVQRYDAAALAAEVEPFFSPVDGRNETHLTPWGSRQAFVYVALRREGSGERPSR